MGDLLSLDGILSGGFSVEPGAWTVERIRLNTELPKNRFTEPPSFFGLLVCPRLHLARFAQRLSPASPTVRRLGS
jgi:hypothetical protein